MKDSLPKFVPITAAVKAIQDKGSKISAVKMICYDCNEPIHLAKIVYILFHHTHLFLLWIFAQSHSPLAIIDLCSVTLTSHYCRSSFHHVSS